MKGRVTNLKMMATLLATAIIFVTNWGVASAKDQAEYHHVKSCTVCHDMGHHRPIECGTYENLRGIACEIETPNSGFRLVKFICDFGEVACDPDGTNSYADGDDTYDGVCEVCHTQTTFHLNTGDDTEHFDGTYCISCHSHTNEFSSPYAQSHATHSTSDKGPGIGCTDCHSDPITFDPDPSDGDPIPTLFADGHELASTTVCDACHSPGGAFDGIDDPVVGAKTNWADGVYEADGTTLMSGKEQWCATCHDDVPAVSGLPGTEVVVDNPAAEFVCAWTLNSRQGYGGSVHYHVAGDGSCTATWTPDLAAGNYNVYAWWTQYSNRATNAKYTVFYDGGQETIEVNQRVNGSQWNYLGNFPFAAGSAGYVVLSDDANGQVIADAIKFSTSVLSTYAPNIVGDNTTYGFYQTGHNINCLSCHDASKDHIDHAHRTYQAALDNYQAGYRLRTVDGVEPMNIPRPGNKPVHDYLDDFALCFDCHNAYEVVGQSYMYDESHTNFSHDPAPLRNGHYYHLYVTSVYFDSDFDTALDSQMTCTACHNVHGAPNQAMIRHGELNGKVPGLNFCYLTSLDPEVCDTEASLQSSEGSMIAPGSSNYVANGICTMGCHTAGLGSQKSERIALLWPKVINAKAEPDTAPNDGSGSTLITTFISDPDGDVSNVVVDLTPIGGSSTQQMYDDGTNGDVTLGDGTYSYLAAIPNGNSLGEKTLGITATDGASNTGDNIATFTVVDLSPQVINAQAEPDTAPDDGTGSTLITASVSDPNSDFSGDIKVDITPIGGGSSQQMYDDGTNGDVTPGDGTYSYLASVSNGTSTGEKALVITATDDAANTGEGTATLTVFNPDVVIVDNPEAEFVCAWTLNSSQGYGGSVNYHAAGDGSCTATWTPNLAAGNYNVYAWWTVYSNRATNAKYTVYYDGGQETIEVNQRSNGDQWNYLGNFPFAAGTSGHVVLSDDANGQVIADAVKFELGDPPPPPPFTGIVDNPEAEFVCAWTLNSVQGYGGSVNYHAAGVGSCTATWRPDLPVGGNYRVHAWWTQYSNRATNAKYTIYYDGDSEPIEVNQRVNGSQWNLLGTYPFVAGTSGYVVLSDDANGYVIADAVWFELVP